jgi:hypothetical protein
MFSRHLGLRGLLAFTLVGLLSEHVFAGESRAGGWPHWPYRRNDWVRVPTPRWDRAPDTAAAQEEAAAAPPSWSVGSSVGMAMQLNWSAEAHAGGEMREYLMFAGLTLEPLYHVTSAIGLGPRLAWGSRVAVDQDWTLSSGETLDVSTTLWEVALGGRFQPRPGRGVHVSAHGGAQVIVDSIGDQSVSDWAPLVAAAVGYDFRLLPTFALGIELRGTHAWFSNEARRVRLPDESGTGSSVEASSFEFEGSDNDVFYRHKAAYSIGLNLTGRLLL